MYIFFDERKKASKICYLLYHFIFYYMIYNGSNADATCNFYPCESVIYVQFPCATKYNRMIDNNHGDRWSRGCPMDDEFSGFYVIDGIKGNNKLIH